MSSVQCFIVTFLKNLTAYVNEGEWEAGDETFDYARISDEEAEEAREGLVEEKGFFILPSELFVMFMQNATMKSHIQGSRR